MTLLLEYKLPVSSSAVFSRRKKKASLYPDKFNLIKAIRRVNWSRWKTNRCDQATANIKAAVDEDLGAAQEPSKQAQTRPRSSFQISRVEALN